MEKKKQMKLGKLATTKFETSFAKLLRNKIPVKVSFKLRGIAGVIKNEVEKYNETLNALIEEHALKNESGQILSENGGIKLDPSQIKEYYLKVKELNNLLVEIPEISVNELGWENIDLVTEDYIELEFITE